MEGHSVWTPPNEEAEKRGKRMPEINTVSWKPIWIIILQPSITWLNMHAFMSAHYSRCQQKGFCGALTLTLTTGPSRKNIQKTCYGISLRSLYNMLTVVVGPAKYVQIICALFIFRHNSTPLQSYYLQIYFLTCENKINSIHEEYEPCFAFTFILLDGG